MWSGIPACSKTFRTTAILLQSLSWTTRVKNPEPITGPVQDSQFILVSYRFFLETNLTSFS